MERHEDSGSPLIKAELRDDKQPVRSPTDNRLPVSAEKRKGRGPTWGPRSKTKAYNREGNQATSFDETSEQTISNGTVRSVKRANQSTSSDETKEYINADGASRSARKKSALKKKKLKLSPDFKAISETLDYLQFEEDDCLNKLLRKNIKCLMSHVGDLCQHTQNPSKETELKSLNYVLRKMHSSLDSSPEEALSVLQKQVPDRIFTSLRALVKEEIKGVKEEKKGLIRSFALCLHLYSIPAYNHVRGKLQDAIPHPRTINTWYAALDKYMY